MEALTQTFHHCVAKDMRDIDCMTVIFTLCYENGFVWRESVFIFPCLIAVSHLLMFFIPLKWKCVTKEESLT